MFGPPSSAPNISDHRFPNDLADLADLDEKTVVTMVRGDDVNGFCARAGRPDLVGQAGRIKPVGVNRHDDQFGRHAFQGSLYAAATATDVVGVHRLGEHHVGVRVKPVRQLAGVVVEVALDRVATTSTQRLLLTFSPPTEAAVELRLTAVGHLGDSSSQPQPQLRTLRLVVVVTAEEAHVLANGQQLRLAPGDLFSRGIGRAGQHDAPADTFGVGDRPLQRAHAAHRSAKDRRPGRDLELVGESSLRGDLITNGDEGEPTPPRTSVGRLRGRTGGALASTQDVAGHDEPAIAVQGSARADPWTAIAGSSWPATSWVDARAPPVRPRRRPTDVRGGVGSPSSPFVIRSPRRLLSPTSSGSRPGRRSLADRWAACARWSGRSPTPNVSAGASCWPALPKPRLNRSPGASRSCWPFART